MDSKRQPASDIQCTNHMTAMNVAQTYLRQGVTVEVWTGQELVGKLGTRRAA